MALEEWLPESFYLLENKLLDMSGNGWRRSLEEAVQEKVLAEGCPKLLVCR